MNTLRQPSTAPLRNALAALALLAAGPTMAATYNIILKSGGTGQSCASGGFTFNKTVVGTFSTTAPSVTLNGSPASLCFGADSARTLSTGNVNVNVANVTLNNQDQGPNVVSIQGSLSSGNGSNNYTLTLTAAGTFTVTQNTGQNPQVGSGTYYVFNTANAVPEPQSLGLVAAALAALALARRLRRRP